MQTQRHIFIGGTGRSGTTILGVILHHHPDVLFFGEPRFLADEGGLGDYLRGRTSAADFAQAMVQNFREKLVSKLVARGFTNAPAVYAPEQLRALVQATLGQGGGRYRNARAFVDQLFGLGLAATGRRHWAEKTPNTILIVDDLYRLYPDMHYLHIIREPKGIYCSLLNQAWGPKTVPEFVTFYNDTMQRALTLQAAIPRSQYFVLSLEGLVRDKPGEVTRVFQFAGLACDPQLVADCVARIRDDGDRPDHWKEALAPADAAAIDTACGPLYRQWLARESASHRA